MVLAATRWNRAVAFTTFASSSSSTVLRRGQPVFPRVPLPYSISCHCVSAATAGTMNASSQPKRRPQVMVIAGPTAVGKSDVAACISDGIIVSADSVQAYTGVQIGANKPTVKELATTPHLLLDMADASVTYNAAEWTRDAQYAIQRLLQLDKKNHDDDDDDDDILWEAGNHHNQQQIQQRHEKIDKEIVQAKKICGFPLNQPVTPIIVGGTMMYLQWLMYGRPDALKPTPTALTNAEEIIKQYQAQDDWDGALSFVEHKGGKFQQQAQKLGSRDWYRLRRMVEVAFTIDEMKEHNDGGGDSDTLYDKLYSGEREGGLIALGYDVRCFFLCPKDRMAHTKIVDERCEQMLESGLIEETADLHLTNRLPGMAEKAIGYRQTLEYLQRENPRDGDVESFLQFVKDFCTATRQYSKRQMQWFRKDKDFLFVPVDMQEEKSKRVPAAAAEIQRMVNLSADCFEKEEKGNPTSSSASTRKENEKQGKGMKVYMMELKRFIEGSDSLHKALEEADKCTNKLQGKKPRIDSVEK